MPVGKGDLPQRGKGKGLCLLRGAQKKKGVVSGGGRSNSLERREKGNCSRCASKEKKARIQNKGKRAGPLTPCGGRKDNEVGAAQKVCGKERVFGGGEEGKNVPYY